MSDQHNDDSTMEYKARGGLGGLGRVWDEDLHPRGHGGKFSSKPGGGTPGGNAPNVGGHPGGGATPDRPATGTPATPSEGAPDTIATTTVHAKGGDITLGRTADGGLTITTPHGTGRLSRNDVADMQEILQNRSFEVGDEAWFSRVDYTPDGMPGIPSQVGRIVRTGKDEYTIAVVDGGTIDDVRNAPTVTATRRDMEALSGRFMDVTAAGRVDTSTGPVDVFLTDDNTFGLRVPDATGHPVELNFDPKSFAKIQHAQNSVIDGVDELDDSPDQPENVTRVDADTNLGRVRVEAFGETAGTGDWSAGQPGNRMEIAAADGSWGITLEGPAYDAWSDVTDNLQSAAEARGIYDFWSMRRKSMRWTVGGLTFKAVPVRDHQRRTAA